MSFYIKKISGEKQLFDIKKFRRSLERAGADKKTVDRLAQEVANMPQLRSTKKIYKYALDKLKQSSPALAARYNLKHALLELGPAGFPFEHFISQLFKAQGYTTEIGQIVQGWCIEHEVDVIATQKKKHCMIECKFHNRQRLKSDVKVSLYIKARFEDIKKAWESEKKDSHEFHEAWLATNTKFTSVAVRYGECANINMLSWSYPLNNALPDLIHRYDLHPITALTTLTKQQKKEFIKQGFVLCRDSEKYKDRYKEFGFTEHQMKKLVQESQEVCRINRKK